MPKKYLLSGVQIQGFRAAKRLHGALFSLGIAPLPDKSHAQAAFVISKKISPKAAERNLIKRRARAAALSPVRRMPPLGLVFVAKKEVARASFADIRVDILALLEKASQIASN